MEGKLFGKLLVIHRDIDYVSPSGYKQKRWLCKCDCGKYVVVNGNSLRTGKTKSCGCLQIEFMNNDNPSKYKNRNKNTYDLSGEYGISYMSKREPFYFDLEDYDLISKYYWSSNGNYLYTNFANNQIVAMHRLLCESKYEVDHINHNTFDNRKENLRSVTKSQNNMNRNVQSNNTSGFRGVIYDKSRNMWKSEIKINGKLIYLGRYKEKSDAIKVRIEAEKKYFGDYNFVN